MDLNPEFPDKSEWLETEHERVYYARAGDKFDRGELDLAEAVSRQFPDCDVVVTMGPYRSHDLLYEIDPDRMLIRLDFYSAAFANYGPGSVRSQRPDHQYGPELIKAIDDAFKQSGVHDAVSQSFKKKYKELFGDDEDGGE